VVDWGETPPENVHLGPIASNARDPAAEIADRRY